jgi:hypothetical protein
MSKSGDFYLDSVTDDLGRCFDDYMAFTYHELESIHDYIQWMFPNEKPSEYNSDAPLLTNYDVMAFKHMPIVRGRAIQSFEKIYKFYNSNNDWITRCNHNYLRITRILKFLRAVELHDEMHEFFAFVVSKYVVEDDITLTALKFWTDAVRGAK